MDSSEYLRLQDAALAKVQTLTAKVERGELAQAEAEGSIISIMQALERDTGGYLPALRRKALVAKLAPWLIALAVVLAILAILAYRLVA